MPSFPPVPIDDLYSSAKKWAEKGDWKQSKDLAIKKAVSIVTCMVGLFSACCKCISCWQGRQGRSLPMLLNGVALGHQAGGAWPQFPAAPLLASPDRCMPVSHAHSFPSHNNMSLPTCIWGCRTAACCLTGFLTWSWAMPSTSGMPEVA